MAVIPNGLMQYFKDKFYWSLIGEIHQIHVKAESLHCINILTASFQIHVVAYGGKNTKVVSLSKYL